MARDTTAPLRITEQPGGVWNENDRLALAGLLIKTGYRVAIVREKLQNSTRSRYVLVADTPTKEAPECDT